MLYSNFANLFTRCDNKKRMYVCIEIYCYLFFLDVVITLRAAIFMQNYSHWWRTQKLCEFNHSATNQSRCVRRKKKRIKQMLSFETLQKDYSNRKLSWFLWKNKILVSKRAMFTFILYSEPDGTSLMKENLFLKYF